MTQIALIFQRTGFGPSGFGRACTWKPFGVLVACASPVSHSLAAKESNV